MHQPSIMHVCTTVLSWYERGRPMYSAVQDNMGKHWQQATRLHQEGIICPLAVPMHAAGQKNIGKQLVWTTGARLGGSKSAAWRHHLPSLLGPCQQLRATATQLLLPCLPSPSCRSLVLPITHRSSLW